MFYLTCTMISIVDLARYGALNAKDWVSVDCGTIMKILSQIENRRKIRSTPHLESG